MSNAYPPYPPASNHPAPTGSATVSYGHQVPGAPGYVPPTPHVPGGEFPKHPTSANFPTSPSNDGRIAWMMGFLAALAAPVVSVLLPAIVMTIMGFKQMRKNPVAARVGRNAAIFGILNILSVVIFAAVLALLIWIDSQYGSHAVSDWWGIVVVPLIIWMLFGGGMVTFIMAFIAAVRPVSAKRAARILGR